MTTATLTSSKRALLSLSHAMEHAVLDQLVSPGGDDGLVVGLFQRREYFDVERELPKLATYLGHVEIGLTYWYIEAIPELLAHATTRLGSTRLVGGPQ